MLQRCWRGKKGKDVFKYKLANWKRELMEKESSVLLQRMIRGVLARRLYLVLISCPSNHDVCRRRKTSCAFPKLISNLILIVYLHGK